MDGSLKIRKLSLPKNIKKDPMCSIEQEEKSRTNEGILKCGEVEGRKRKRVWRYWRGRENEGLKEDRVGRKERPLLRLLL